MRPLLKQHGWRLFFILLGFWAIFIMDLGGRSFATHLARILRTPESRELGSEMVAKVSELASAARRRVLLAFGPSDQDDDL